MVVSDSKLLKSVFSFLLLGVRYSLVSLCILRAHVCQWGSAEGFLFLSRNGAVQGRNPWLDRDTIEYILARGALNDPGRGGNEDPGDGHAVVRLCDRLCDRWEEMADSACCKFISISDPVFGSYVDPKAFFVIRFLLLPRVSSDSRTTPFVRWRHDCRAAAEKCAGREESGATTGSSSKAGLHDLWQQRRLRTDAENVASIVPSQKRVHSSPWSWCSTTREIGAG